LARIDTHNIIVEDFGKQTSCAK